MNLVKLSLGIPALAGWFLVVTYWGFRLFIGA